MENRWEYVVGGLVLDMRRIEARIDGGPPILFTRQEWNVLTALAQHPGVIINARRLVGDVGMYRTDDEAARTARVWIRRLRRKLDDPATHARFIHSRRGFGWMIEDRGEYVEPEPRAPRPPGPGSAPGPNHPWRSGL